MYLWQRKAWPDLTLDFKALAGTLALVSREQGRLLGRMQSLGFEQQTAVNLRSVTDDVLTSSEIEGEKLNRAEVRSSVARRLHLDVGGLVPAGRDVEGVVEMMLDATVNYAKPLTEQRLFAWHASLFPTGSSGMHEIAVGQYRDDRNGAMQVVSGPHGRRTVHYEAPPADRIADEMSLFLAWLEAPNDLDPLLTAGLAHLWLLTIHPFEDGNGRIARAISDMMLARTEGTSQRFYSMSSQIMADRKAYYDQLQRSQQGPLDATTWIQWFLSCLLRSIEVADDTLGSILHKAQFWDRFAQQPLNARQVKVLNRVLDGFEGKLTSSKWAKLAQCSQDTAHRDILDLIARGALQKDARGGRSTSYSLVE